MIRKIIRGVLFVTAMLFVAFVSISCCLFPPPGGGGGPH